MAGPEFRPRSPGDHARLPDEADDGRSERHDGSADLPAPSDDLAPEELWTRPDLWHHPEVRMGLELETEDAAEQRELFEEEDALAWLEPALPPDHPERLIQEADLAGIPELSPPDWEVIQDGDLEPWDTSPVWEALVEPETGLEPDEPIDEELSIPLAETREIEEVSGVRLLEDEQLEEVGRRLVDVLDPEAWAKADLAERMVLAQRAHAFIREAYGLERSPLLYDLNLPPQVAGRFDPSTGQVSINASLLEEDHPGELLDTIAHENRHAVQVDLMQEIHQAWDQGIEEPDRAGVDWSVVAGWTDAWTRYDANDAATYHENELEVDARRAGLQLAGNGYWRAYMERMAG
jgi:hypothetical protein